MANRDHYQDDDRPSRQVPAGVVVTIAAALFAVFLSWVLSDIDRSLSAQIDQAVQDIGDACQLHAN